MLNTLTIFFFAGIRFLIVLMLFCPVQSQEFHFSRVEEVPDLSFLPDVFTGLDMLEQIDMKPLRGKTIAVLCNYTAIDRDGRHLLDILKAYKIKVKTIFVPEFGLFESNNVQLRLIGRQNHDPGTGAQIVDLFNRFKKPPDWSLDEVDLILVDIFDTGVRYSTYITTITKVMEAASDWDIPMLVLDRPNPLGGVVVQGPVTRPAFQSFEGYHLVPIRHGLTIGEQVIMVNEMGWANDLARVDLTVVPLVNWKRDQRFDQTGLRWINPGPNINDPETLLAYTGMALLKGTNLNVGQGTDKPFLRVGAPWLSGQHLAEKLSSLNLTGVTFSVVRYKPYLRPGEKSIPLYTDEFCGGIDIKITDHEMFDPLATATAIILITHRLYPREFQWAENDYIDKLFGSNLLRTYSAQGKPPSSLPHLWMHDVIRFNEFRKRFLLY